MTTSDENPSPADPSPAGPSRVERATRVVHAPAAAIFDVLADPRRHADIDGSGSVRRAQDTAPQRLALGSRFGMQMRIGLPYRISNEVVEFDEGRRIAWRHLGGHVWRYLLEPLDDGSTAVTEEFDWRSSRAPWVLQIQGAPRRNARAMEETLAKLAALVETSAAP